MAEGKFATAINCMDGRTQIPVINWFREHYGIDYVDAVTEPGPVLHLAEGNGVLIESIRGRVWISVNGHGSNVVGVVAHDGCAGNPKPKDAQLVQMDRAIGEIKSWGLGVKIIGLYVNNNTDVELVRE